MMPARVRALYVRRPGGVVITSYVSLPRTATTTVSELAEATLAALDIGYSQLHTPLTQQCIGTCQTRRRCERFVSLEQPHCEHHQPARTHGTVTATTITRTHGTPMSLRALLHNPVYRAYARCTGLTVSQRWAADNHHTAAFDRWADRERQRFLRAHPAAEKSSDTRRWLAWLDALRPETTVQQEHV